MYNPYLTMPLGVDNIFIQIAPDDIGSIIAHGLNSNSYFEALLKVNYSGLASKLPKQSKGHLETVWLLSDDDVFNNEIKD